MRKNAKKMKKKKSKTIYLTLTFITKKKMKNGTIITTTIESEE